MKPSLKMVREDILRLINWIIQWTSLELQVRREFLSVLLSALVILDPILLINKQDSMDQIIYMILLMDYIFANHLILEPENREMSLHPNTCLDIIDKEYVLIHHFPPSVELQAFIEFMTNWKIAYIIPYSGFLLTEAQAKGFRIQLHERFGIVYDDPPIDFQHNIFHTTPLPLLSQLRFHLSKQPYLDLRWILPSQIPYRFEHSFEILKKISNLDFCLLIGEKETQIKWYNAITINFPGAHIHSDCHELYPFFMNLEQSQTNSKRFLIVEPEKLDQLKLLENMNNSILIYDSQLQKLTDQQLLLLRNFEYIMLLPTQEQEQDYNAKVKMIGLLANKEPLSCIKSRYESECHELEVKKVLNSYRLEKETERQRGEEETEIKKTKQKKSILKKQKKPKGSCLKKVRFDC